MFKHFSANNATSMSSACKSSRKSSSNASDDDNHHSNHVINENISNDQSDENDITRWSFQFPHDFSLANEWKNYSCAPVSKE